MLPDAVPVLPERYRRDHGTKCSDSINQRRVALLRADFCLKHFLLRYAYLPDDELFFVSGAQTASWRVLGNSKYWFKDEELSNSDLNEAIGLYKDTRPKIVISQTAPAEGAKEILRDLNGSYFLNKHSDAESRTSRALQENVRGTSALRLAFRPFSSQS